MKPGSRENLYNWGYAGTPQSNRLGDTTAPRRKDAAEKRNKDTARKGGMVCGEL